MKLSHTGKETYLMCPQQWKLHYQDRLRPTTVGSALFFGGAIDEALNRMLLEKKKTLDDSELLLMNSTPEETFLSTFQKVYLLGKYVDISKNPAAIYYKSDLDLTLLEAKDYKEIVEFAQNKDIDLDMTSLEQFIEEVQGIFKKGKPDEATHSVYNFICWLSLRNKGLMMLEAYRVQIMPEIEEVFDVQKRISLPDADDEFVGVIDAVCSFNSEPGIKYVCDNKTSSRAYKDDSVLTSEQLAAYSEYEQINKCAYIVVEKKLRKREPRVRCSIIKDTMPEETVNETFDKITDVFHNISDEKFDKNFDSCFQYGRKCVYYDFCRTGGLSGLQYLESKEKKNESND